METPGLVERLLEVLRPGHCTEKRHAEDGRHAREHHSEERRGARKENGQ